MSDIVISDKTSKGQAKTTKRSQTWDVEIENAKPYEPITTEIKRIHGKYTVKKSRVTLAMTVEGLLNAAPPDPAAKGNIKPVKHAQTWEIEALDDYDAVNDEMQRLSDSYDVAKAKVSVSLTIEA